MTENKNQNISAPAVVAGVEDKFYYEITDECVMCGACAPGCPVGAIELENDRYVVNAKSCIDCGTCSVLCPTGAAHRTPYIRESIAIDEIDMSKCYFNPGCAVSLYKLDVPEKMLELLREHLGDVKPHNICCHHDPGLESGSTIINNCAGCDRRFRSLYEGVSTISFWEVVDSIPDLKLPDHSGLKVSIHDSCGFRHKPQVHRAVRSLLSKMNIELEETEFSGTKSVCCGDNYYGIVPDEQVVERFKLRADQFPCDDVVVYCIGCVRAMTAGGKTAHYLPDLLFDRTPEPVTDTMTEYHAKLDEYIKNH